MIGKAAERQFTHFWPIERQTRLSVKPVSARCATFSKAKLLLPFRLSICSQNIEDEENFLSKAVAEPFSIAIRSGWYKPEPRLAFTSVPGK